MATYRFAGVKTAPKAKTTEQCCEPFCGPATCGGASAEVKDEPKAKEKAVK